MTTPRRPTLRTILSEGILSEGMLISDRNSAADLTLSKPKREFLSYFFVKKYLLVGASSMLWTGQRISESMSQ